MNWILKVALSIAILALVQCKADTSSVSKVISEGEAALDELNTLIK